MFEETQSEEEVVQHLSTENGILPLADFVGQASNILRVLRCSGEPMVLIEDGKAAGVVMTPSAFDALQDEIAFLKAVGASMTDSDEDDVPHERVREWLDSLGTPNELPLPE